MRHPLVEFVKFLAAIVLLCLTRNPSVSVLFLILEFVIAPSVKSVLALLGMTADVYKRQRLYKTVREACRFLDSMLAGIVPIRPDR